MPRTPHIVIALIAASALSACGPEASQIPNASEAPCPDADC